MKKFFTSDWHLGSNYVLQKGARPFKNIDKMNEWIIKQCNLKTKKDDIVYHIGDFLNYGNDRGIECLRLKFNDYKEKINPQMLFIEGNHDKNNGVKTIGNLIFTNIGKYNVTIGHLPSNSDLLNEKKKDQIGKHHIHICGHVHSAWKYYIDFNNKILNINIGVDVWNYRIVSENELINYINNVFKENPKLKKIIPYKGD